MKKISHVISSIDLSMGGLAKSASDLCISLASTGVDVTLITHESPNPYFRDLSLSKVSYFFFNRTISPYSVSLKSQLRKTINTGSGLFHGHGLWQLPIHQMSCIARSCNLPYIISPHGMLEPWSLNNKKWKKKVAMILYQHRDLVLAHCIHTTSLAEAENIRRLGYKNPIAIIPNGIDLQIFRRKSSGFTQEKRKVLFLSRLDPKKGIEILIQAWASLPYPIRQLWELDIAGDGNPNYVTCLKNQIAELGLDKEIHFIGPQFGENLIKTYHQSDIFVLPTFSENFGIVVIEALACGLPVITTKGAPWEELRTHDAGWWIDFGREPLKVALEHALSLSDSERHALGLNGSKLVSEKYTLDGVAKEMLLVYEWILEGGPSPSCVLFN